MAYSQEDIDLVKNRLLEVAKRSSQSWSDVDDQIFNAFWEDKKDNPNAILDFPINQPQQKQAQQKSGESSPFRVENGVVTYRGKPTIELSEEERRGLFGSVGGDILNDPRFRRTVQVGQGDAGFVEEEQVDPELQQRLFRDGQWYRQVGALRSVGGEGEVADVSRIVWDEELGWITPMSNVREYEDTVFTPGMLLAAGGMLGAIGMAGGFSGLGIGGAAAEGTAASGFPAGAGIAGPSLETAGIATGGLEAATTGAATTGAATTGAAATGAGSGSLGLVSGLEPITLPATNLAAPTLTALPEVGGASWLPSLSPMSQRAIMSGLSMGANAILANRRQESSQDFARQQYERQQEDRRQEEERLRQERERRGTPSAYQFNVTRRTGLVGSNMGG